MQRVGGAIRFTDVPCLFIMLTVCLQFCAFVTRGCTGAVLEKPPNHCIAGRWMRCDEVEEG